MQLSRTSVIDSLIIKMHRRDASPTRRFERNQPVIRAMISPPFTFSHFNCSL